MNYANNNDIHNTLGYLIVEYSQGARPKILYANNTACTLTGLSIQDLLVAEPTQITTSLLCTRLILNISHELWVLDACLDNPCPLTELDHLKYMNMELLNTLNVAEEENKAKSSFLSSMSHDIRTPMNAILGMTSIGLSHIDEKARVHDCLQKILTASNHLMSLVNDVLDMSRITSGRMVLNEEAFSLADMVHDITIIARPQATQKHQQFEIEIGQIYEENLMGDSLRLRQILVNIIGNAVKYTQENGKIHVQFSQHIDSLQSNQPTIWMDFVCKDNGIGMSPEFLERIFVPFERVNNAAVSKIEGTGLGMSIVKNLLDRMHGTISVESTEGAGSCFYVSIPFPPALQNQENPHVPEGELILLAESVTERAQQILTYLQDAGMSPIHIQNGLDAVTWLTEAHYEHRMPCALLLGQELADMPVLEMASHVRQLAGRDFPILYIAEVDWAQIEYRATRAGISAFVPCPLFKSRLLETISSFTCNTSNSHSNDINSTIDYSKYRLLLVEDNELNREIAVELLSSTGVQIETATDGLCAVETFEHSPEHYFDLIFMDIQMPIMNGYDAARKIRQLPRKDATSIWIVAMTANAFVEDIRLAKEAGMNEHCSKPVDLERLHDILRKRFKS